MKHAEKSTSNVLLLSSLSQRQLVESARVPIGTPSRDARCACQEPLLSALLAANTKCADRLERAHTAVPPQKKGQVGIVFSRRNQPKSKTGGHEAQQHTDQSNQTLNPGRLHHTSKRPPGGDYRTYPSHYTEPPPSFPSKPWVSSRCQKRGGSGTYNKPGGVQYTVA